MSRQEVERLYVSLDFSKFPTAIVAEECRMAHGHAARKNELRACRAARGRMTPAAAEGALARAAAAMWNSFDEEFGSYADEHLPIKLSLMYLPEPFKTQDLRALDRLAAYNAFGTLVSQSGGAPFASHLPVLYRRAEDRVTLSGHWARANPQWREIEGQRVLLILHGPHAYISPRWYLEPEKNVPTWNYAVAHVYGRVRVIHEVAELQRIVTALAVQYEAGAQEPWRFEDTGDQGRARLKAIVGFELAADEVEVKLKLNQNHVEGNVRGAIEGLRALGSADAREVADWMESALEQGSRGSGGGRSR